MARDHTQQAGRRGAALGLVVGLARGVPLVLSCTFVGALPYQDVYAIPTCGAEGPGL